MVQSAARLATLRGEFKAPPGNESGFFMLSLVLLAIVAYAATNIDNLFVLLGFLTEAGVERVAWSRASTRDH